MAKNYKNYTNKEMQAITIAKEIKDGQIVIVGTGLPLIGATVAKNKFAPNCKLIVESGLMDCSPIEVPRSVGDLRLMGHCAVQWPNVRFIGFETNEYLNGNDRMIAFIGGAQINPYGDLNSTIIGDDYIRPKTRFTGSGGANGIATYSNTGPGGREKLGLPGNRGPLAVVTDKGVLRFDEKTKRMYLAGYYPGVTIEDIIENTGFEIDTSRAVQLEAPSEEIIKMIREDIDPGQAFIKVPVEE